MAKTSSRSTNGSPDRVSAKGVHEIKTTARHFQEQALTMMPELPVAQADAPSLLSWLTNLVPFFKIAGELEARAAETLARVRTIQPPRTAAEDTALQSQCKQITIDIKELRDHWNWITSAFYNFHRRLTAARGRGEAFLEESSNITNRLHGDYVDEAKRVAAREADRQREERERLAREERQRELDAIEKKATEAEALSEDLSDRERAFVQRCYAALGVDLLSERWLNAAARGCGFKQEGYGVILYARPKVRQAIDGMKQAVVMRQQAEAVKELPLEVRHTEVKTNIVRPVGVTGDREYWGGDCFDEAALIQAVLDPVTRVRLGIPIDVLTISSKKMNEYGEALHERLDLWPGCKHRKTRKVV